MNHESADNDSLDQRLDALLASRPVAPRADFHEAIFRAIENGTDADALDTLVDARLRHHPLRTRPERTEKFFANVLRADHARKIIRWSVPALAASVALLLALPAFLTSPATTPAPEEMLAEAMAGDPALAAMLRSSTSTTAAFPALDREVVDAVSGLNDNTLAWLETLTRDETY